MCIYIRIYVHIIILYTMYYILLIILYTEYYIHILICVIIIVIICFFK